jgi:hypothetical protein
VEVVPARTEPKVEPAPGPAKPQPDDAMAGFDTLELEMKRLLGRTSDKDG